MAFGYGPTSWLDQGAQAWAAPGGLSSLGLGGGPAAGDGSSLLFDSDGYPVSIGAGDWPYVSALGLDTYSRLGRMLGSDQGPGDAGAWTPANGEVAPNVGPPPPTSVAPGTQSVGGIGPADLASLTPLVAPQLSPQGGAHDQASDPSAGLDPPPLAVTAMGAGAVAPVATPDTSALAGLPSFAVDSDYLTQPDDAAWRVAQQAYGAGDLRAGFEALIRSNRLRLTEDGAPLVYRGQRLTLPDLSSMDPRTRTEFDRAGGQRLAHIAQLAAARQAPLDLFAQTPPWTAAPQTAALAPAFSQAGSSGFSEPPGLPSGAPQIGAPLPYWTAALRDGDRGYQDAKARYDQILYPSTIQRAVQSGLDPAGIGRSLSALDLAAESSGDFVGGLLRPILPDDPNHPGRQALRDLLGGAIVNLPGFATGEGEAAEANNLREAITEGIYWFPDLWAKDGSMYVGQTGKGWARPDYWVRVGRADPAAITFREVPGGREAREIAEHSRIQEFTAGQRARNSLAVSNQRGPIGARRRVVLAFPIRGSSTKREQEGLSNVR
ncbi:MAG TPA: hypothetical protein VN814_03865 [Caulobacteraceae bacterium]|nr:hypothetical protein [Caulobacteraceae bacterium]